MPKYIIKKANIIYNRKKYIQLIYIAETRDGKIIKHNRIVKQYLDYYFKDLDFKHENHITIINDELKDKLALVDNPSLVEIEGIENLIAWDLLEEINFFKVIKASQLDKVRISPRMKHNPIIYSFILPQRFSKIFGRLSRKLFISQIPIFDFKELGRTNDWNIININGLKELEGVDAMSIANKVSHI